VTTTTDVREFFERHGYAPANSELGRAETRLRLALNRREFAGRGLGPNQDRVSRRNQQIEVERVEDDLGRQRRRVGLG
jgi:hypothetical protein